MADQGEHSDGRRFVGLYKPYPSAGRTISSVTFKPMTYGHLVSWQLGQYESANALLLDLTGLEPDQLYGLRRPDDERVLTAFLEHVHPVIRADIEDGRVPVSQPGDRQGFTAAPPAPGGPAPAPEPGSFADMALRAADAAEARASQRTAEQEAEELRLSAEADALDEGPPAGYKGAFAPD